MFRVRALFDYNAEQEGDLSFKKDEVIEVVASDTDWWQGLIITTGDEGYFPSNFVEKLPEDFAEVVEVDPLFAKAMEIVNPTVTPSPKAVTRPPNAPKVAISPAVTSVIANPARAVTPSVKFAGGGRKSAGELAAPVAIEVQVIALEQRPCIDPSTSASDMECFYTIRVLSSTQVEHVEEKRYADIENLAQELRTKFPSIELATSLPPADVTGRVDQNGLQVYLRSFLFVKSLATLLLNWMGEEAEMFPPIPVPSKSGSPMPPPKRGSVLGAPMVPPKSRGTSFDVPTTAAPSASAAAAALITTNTGRASVGPKTPPKKKSVTAGEAEVAAGGPPIVITCKPISAASYPILPRVHDFNLESLDAFDELMDRGFTIERKGGPVPKTPFPEVGQTVEVEYQAMVWDGGETNIVEFEVSNGPVCFTIGEKEVITGLDEAIRYVNIGDRVNIIIAPEKGYGALPAKGDRIPASSHLVYFITLLRCGTRGESVGAVNVIKEAMTREISEDEELLGISKPKVQTGFINIRGKNPAAVKLDVKKVEDEPKPTQLAHAASMPVTDEYRTRTQTTGSSELLSAYDDTSAAARFTASRSMSTTSSPPSPPKKKPKPPAPAGGSSASISDFEASPPSSPVKHGKHADELRDVLTPLAQPKKAPPPLPVSTLVRSSTIPGDVTPEIQRKAPPIPPPFRPVNREASSSALVLSSGDSGGIDSDGISRSPYDVRTPPPPAFSAPSGIVSADKERVKIEAARASPPSGVRSPPPPAVAAPPGIIGTTSADRKREPGMTGTSLPPTTAAMLPYSKASESSYGGGAMAIDDRSASAPIKLVMKFSPPVPSTAGPPPGADERAATSALISLGVKLNSAVSASDSAESDDTVCPPPPPSVHMKLQQIVVNKDSLSQSLLRRTDSSEAILGKAARPPIVHPAAAEKLAPKPRVSPASMKMSGPIPGVSHGVSPPSPSAARPKTMMPPPKGITPPRGVSPSATTPPAPPEVFLAYSILKDATADNGIDPSMKENHLAEREFLEVFKMPLKEFQKLPKWKRDNLKKAAGLF